MWFPIIAFLLSFFGVLLFKKFALKFKFVAVPNERSLHKKETPQGGGIIISLIVLSFIFYLYLSGDMQENEFFAIFMGGLILSVIGFLDDILEINAGVRLIIQILVASWSLYLLGGIPYTDFFSSIPEVYIIVNFIAIVIFVWFVNAFNFIDGIDGLASSNAFFFSISIGGYFLWQKIEPYGSVLIVLAAASLAFLFFNWPQAKIFLGDAGSNFFGYIFGIILLITVKKENISIWTWLIIFTYLITDTTTTTILRMFLVKGWYHTHRSHAYQNLARVLENHKFVTQLILCFDVIYLLPLAYLSICYHQFAWLAFLFGVIPVFVFVLKFGPLYAR